MPKTNVNREAAPQAVVDTIARLGAGIAEARLRRRWTQDMLAARAGLTRPTLRRVEAGELGTGIGAYAAVLWALGLHHPLADLAAIQNDAEGATLVAARLGSRARPPGSVDDDF